MNVPRSVHAGGWAITAIAGALLGLVIRPVPLTTVLGPAVEHWLWLPPALAGMAVFAGDRPEVASVLSLASRLGIWVLAALWLADPAPNGPDILAMWARTAGATIRTVMAGLAGLLVVGAVIALFLSPAGSPRDERRTTVTAGSSLGPLSAVLLRLGLRTGLWLVATLVRVAVLLIAWTVLGSRGAVSVARGAGDDGLGSILGRVFAAIGGGSSAVGRWLSSASSGWGKREKHGVWVLLAALARDASGDVIEDLDWSPGADETTDETELREFALGLIAAYDVALSSGSRASSGQREPGQDPRTAPPKLVPYRIEVARAWTQPDYHAVVMRITPPAAATAAARLGTDALVPALDAATSLTSSDLRRLRLSDRRLAADPLRAGVAGLFVALDRAPESAVRSGGAGDLLTRAVTRAVEEAGLDDRFRFTSRDDGFDADTLEYRASLRSSVEYRELLITGLAGTRLRMDLDRVPLWRGDHVSLRQLVDDFARYHYLPRLAGPDVLVESVRDGLKLLLWHQEGFAYADNFDEAEGRYRGLRTGQLVNVSENDLSGLLVRPEVAQAQVDRETPMPDEGGETEGDGPNIDAWTPIPPPPPGSTAPIRYHGTVRLDPTRAGRDASKIADEVLAHLSGAVGATVTVTLEIEATLPGGASEHTVRTVTQNGRDLHFDPGSGFESE